MYYSVEMLGVSANARIVAAAWEEDLSTLFVLAAGQASAEGLGALLLEISDLEPTTDCHTIGQSTAGSPAGQVSVGRWRASSAPKSFRIEASRDGQVILRAALTSLGA